MGCRCNERKDAISRGASAAVRGNVKAAASAGAFVARTLVQDARAGALRTAATSQLAALKSGIMRRR